MTHASARYLEAKRTVDDRSLSRRVRDRLLAELPSNPRILEAGCGTGTTVPRLIEWGVRSGSYRGVDLDPAVVSFARRIRPRAMRREGDKIDPTDRGFVVDDFSVAFETGDALVAFEDEVDADLFVAQSFADLVPLSDLVETFESALRPGGLAYLPLTFDGTTVFQPDHPDDSTVERAYHRAMNRQPGRDIHAGRHLADLLYERPGDVLAMAASDWIVRPSDAGYPADERYFLECILDIVEETIMESTECIPELEKWLSARRDQLSEGALLYVAHQYDILYRTARV